VENEEIKLATETNSTMKYARAFEALVALIPKIIKVTLVDATNGNELGKHKIPASQLPAIFNKPTTLFIDNTYWRVLDADPVSADDFQFSRKLTLLVVESTQVNGQQLYFDLPTIADQVPATGIYNQVDQFNLQFDIAQWRQVEFLPLSELSVIEETISDIEKILAMQNNALRGYQQQCKRIMVKDLSVHIPIHDFYPLLDRPVTGSILLNESMVVQNGFAIRSENHTYYGIMENDSIRNLCMSEFDYADEELMKVLSAFSLTVIDWCNASRLSAEEGDTPKNEFIKIS
jgi:hypothetical protein